MPKTNAAPLRWLVVLTSMYIGLCVLAEAVPPLVKYRAYFVYFVEVNWKEYFEYAPSLFFAVALWRLKRWARLLYLAFLWMVAIVIPPMDALMPDGPYHPLWDANATFTKNLTESQLLRDYVVAALALIAIHILQRHKSEFRGGV